MTDIAMLEHVPWVLMSTPERTATVRHFVGEGWSAGAIAEKLHATRNAVMGVAHRTKGTSDPIEFRYTVVFAHGASPEQKAAQRGRDKARQIKKSRVPPKVGQRAVQPAVGQPVPKALPPPPDAAWRPLPGSSPVPMADLPPASCLWPVGPGSPHLFCALPADTGSPYCPAHRALGRRRRPDETEEDLDV